jgi:hypothetical protein
VPGHAGRAAARSALVLALLPAAALGWHAEGHRRTAEDAVGRLPDGVPAFLREGAAEVARAAVEPDLRRLRELRHLADREAPDHFLDLERLPTDAWIEPRSALAARGVPVAGVGRLPQAILEGVERLVLAFAQHRRDPDDAGVRAAALAAAGWLAHDAGDLEQPLHTTVHHDGWALADGSSPREGIHRRIDALLERTPIDRPGAVSGLAVEPFDDPPAAVRAELLASHALVDRVYELDSELVDEEGYGRGEVVAFACERHRATVGFVARLILTAWRDSAAIELPDWSVERGAAPPER